MLAAKTQYAVLAMIELAILYPEGKPVQAARIAERHGIPLQFLLQILHQLKLANLVTSKRGASGGYSLSRSPEEVTLAEVVNVVESVEEPGACAAERSPLAPLMVEACRDLAHARWERLACVSLASLANNAAEAAEPMWYI